MKPTAIQRMVDVLKSQIVKTGHGDLTEFGEGSIYFLKDMLDNAEMFLKQEQDEARRLAQEANAKPQADAELVELSEVSKIFISNDYEDNAHKHIAFYQLPRYQPSPQTDILADLKALIPSECEADEERFKYYPDYIIEEIIRKHDGKCYAKGEK